MLHGTGTYHIYYTYILYIYAYFSFIFNFLNNSVASLIFANSIQKLCISIIIGSELRSVRIMTLFLINDCKKAQIKRTRRLYNNKV